MPDQALELVKVLRAEPATNAANLTNQVVLLRLEAMAHFAKDEPATADKLLQTAVQQHPQNEMVLASVAQIYSQFHLYTNALATVEQQLRTSPDNPQALLSKGTLFIQLKAYDQAVAPLNRLLELDPQNTAGIINRAIANLQLGKLDEAKRDYETARKILPRYGAIYYGLGDIASRQKNREAALQNYQLYLKYAPAGTEEARAVAARLEKLKSGSF
jgi:tetratricopeptide (TPR) repeat protein